MSINHIPCSRKIEIVRRVQLSFLWLDCASVHMGLSQFQASKKSRLPPDLCLQSQQCPECKTDLGAANELYCSIAVCDHCGYHFVWSASDRIEHLADPGSFRPIRSSIQPVDFLGFVDELPYSMKLISGQKQTGLSDAILIGRCRIGGTESVLAVLDFHFMGGSMGSVVGEQITIAFEYATETPLTGSDRSQ